MSYNNAGGKYMYTSYKYHIKSVLQELNKPTIYCSEYLTTQKILISER